MNNQYNIIAAIHQTVAGLSTTVVLSKIEIHIAIGTVSFKVFSLNQRIDSLLNIRRLQFKKTVSNPTQETTKYKGNIQQKGT
jgi:hypothetical protein